MSSKTTQAAMTGDIRWMVRRDMSQVLAIENASFQYPWTEEDFLSVMRQRNCIGMVFDRIPYGVTTDRDIAGFMLYELHRSKLWVMNIAVDTASRRQGVGAAMIRKLQNKLSQQGRYEIGMHVRETNLDAQLFLRQCGFRAARVIRDHYRETEEDAYVMEYRLPDVDAMSCQITK